MKATNIKSMGPGTVVPRLLDLEKLLSQKSHFLFGPRQTGKTFLIRQTLKTARVYDLLDSSVYLTLSRNPGRIAEELDSHDRLVVIDEIQRIPELLNEVHRLIEERGVRFLLTGSSARKLRRGGVNLLGGRARTRYLHPLTYRELGDHPEGIRRNLPAAGDRRGGRGSQYPGLQPIPPDRRALQLLDRQFHQCRQRRAGRPDHGLRIFRNSERHADHPRAGRLAEIEEAETAGFFQILFFRCRGHGGASGAGVSVGHARIRGSL